MRSFFRGLEARGGRYLLISGQASVLYGAAAFSEDVDIWLEPRPASIEALIGALGEGDARVYKLTPPLRLEHFVRGHGFHFRLPDDEGGPAFLDVMGRPPRVKGFGGALQRAVRMATPWGTVPVCSILDLVALKKTRRLADYDVITNLVRLRISSLGHAPGPAQLSWALRHAFRVEEAAWLLDSSPAARKIAGETGRAALRLLLLSRHEPGAEIGADLYGRVQRLMAREIAELQQADVAWWSEIIQELRAMRRAGALLPEGAPVADIAT